jgi:hypothetical protein
MVCRLLGTAEGGLFYWSSVMKSKTVYPYQIWCAHRKYFEEGDYSLGQARAYRIKERAIKEYEKNLKLYGEITVLELREYQDKNTYKTLFDNFQTSKEVSS